MLLIHYNRRWVFPIYLQTFSLIYLKTFSLMWLSNNLYLLIICRLKDGCISHLSNQQIAANSFPFWQQCLELCTLMNCNLLSQIWDNPRTVIAIWCIDSTRTLFALVHNTSTLDLKLSSNYAMHIQFDSQSFQKREHFKDMTASVFACCTSFLYH